MLEAIGVAIVSSVVTVVVTVLVTRLMNRGKPKDLEQVLVETLVQTSKEKEELERAGKGKEKSIQLLLDLYTKAISSLDEVRNALSRKDAELLRLEKAIDDGPIKLAAHRIAKQNHAGYKGPTPYEDMFGKFIKKKGTR